MHEIGSAVTNVVVGDTVIVHPLVTCGLCRACRAGDDVHCENNLFPGISVDGGFAELLKTGARAVVIGAGGLGHIGIQCLAATTPAQIIVVDPSERARALAGEIGADHTIAADGRQVDTVLELTDGRGAEAIIDFVGERGAIQDGVAVLRQAGSYYVMGYGENVNVPTIDIISREINFIGTLVASYNDLSELMTLTAQGKVTLHTSAYPLEAVNDAMADLDGGRLQGRASSSPTPRRSRGQPPWARSSTSTTTPAGACSRASTSSPTRSR